jgi:hypothetical protein
MDSYVIISQDLKMSQVRDLTFALIFQLLVDGSTTVLAIQNNACCTL